MNSLLIQRLMSVRHFTGIGLVLTILLVQPARADTRAALAELEREAWVVDVLYDASLAVQWTIGMFNTGHTREWGYAETACNILLMNGVQTEWLRVVDIAKVNNGETFRSASLGRVNCKTWRRKHP